VSDAHDRYANQEVSYLLQRIEAYAGVVILASNLRHHIDDAFLRRFQSVVHFALPKAAERLRLWREGIPAEVRPEAALDLARLAQQHELSGGTIVNVLRYGCLRALARGDAVLRADDVDEGVRRELLKEGRAL
jgi:SpoVK/Ycf46/Vps4 family AAA+-type ATPase